MIYNYEQFLNENAKLTTENFITKNKEIHEDDYSKVEYKGENKINKRLDNVFNNKSFPYKKCKEEASKYKTIEELKDGNKLLYAVISNNGWIEKIFGYEKQKYKDGRIFDPVRYQERLVYEITFEDNSKYIGLTNDLKFRFAAHLNHGVIKDYIEKTGLKPILNQLTPMMKKEDAQIKEIEYVEKYRNEGWKILNKMAAGGLGGCYIRYTYEEIIETAKKYNTWKEFRKKHLCMAKVAYRKKWLNNLKQDLNLKNYWKDSELIDF